MLPSIRIGLAVLGCVVMLLGAGCACGAPDDADAAVRDAGIDAADDGSIDAGPLPVDAQVVDAHAAARDAQCDRGEGTVVPPGPIRALHVSDDATACVTLEDDRLFCWGALVRDPGEIRVPRPRQIAGYHVAVGIRGWPWVSLDGSGAPHIWPVTLDDPRAVDALSSLGRFVDVAVGEAHRCVLHEDGRVFCWGGNRLGQTGDPAILDGKRPPVETVSPRQVPLAVPAVALGMGAMFSCAIDGGGGAMCWGDDHWGTLGDGRSTSDPTPTPVRVVGLSGAVEIDGGSKETCARTSEGEVLCWGISPPFATGGAVPHLTPRRVLLAEPSIDIAVGDYVACSVRVDGSLVCWGTEHSGNLFPGVLQRDGPPREPAVVTGVLDVRAVDVGEQETCVLLDDDRIQCWGACMAGACGYSCDRCETASGGHDCANEPVTILW